MSFPKRSRINIDGRMYERPKLGPALVVLKKTLPERLPLSATRVRVEITTPDGVYVGELKLRQHPEPPF